MDSTGRGTGTGSLPQMQESLLESTTQEGGGDVDIRGVSGSYQRGTEKEWPTHMDRDPHDCEVAGKIPEQQMGSENGAGYFPQAWQGQSRNN